MVRSSHNRQFLGGLAGAIALHALVIGGGFSWSRALGPRNEEPSAPAAPANAVIEIVYGDVHGDAIPGEGATLAEQEDSQRRAKRPRRSEPEPARIEPDEAQAASPYALDPTATSGPSAPSKIELGIEPGQWSRWVEPPLSAAKEAEHATTESIRRTFDAHDREVGMGPSGAVVSAFRDATTSEISPQVGTAMFTVTVLRSGEVSVALESASDHSADWSDVGDRVAAALRSKPPRIAAHRKGVRLVLEIVADERWANGTLARPEEWKVRSEAPPVRSTKEAQEELARRNPAAAPPPGAPAEQVPLAANTQPTGAFLARRGKVCDLRLGVGTPPVTADNADADQARPATTQGPANGAAGSKLRIGPLLTGGCDPSNAATPAARRVSTRVVSETML